MKLVGNKKKKKENALTFKLEANNLFAEFKTKLKGVTVIVSLVNKLIPPPPFPSFFHHL